MRALSATLALTMFAGYFAPIAVKLLELPLFGVLLGAAALVAIDAWESLRE